MIIGVQAAEGTPGTARPAKLIAKQVDRAEDPYQDEACGHTPRARLRDLLPQQSQPAAGGYPADPVRQEGTASPY